MTVPPPGRGAGGPGGDAGHGPQAGDARCCSQARARSGWSTKASGPLAPTRGRRGARHGPTWGLAGEEDACLAVQGSGARVLSLVQQVRAWLPSPERPAGKHGVGHHPEPLLDGDTGSLRGHGMSHAARSRAPCLGPACALRASSPHPTSPPRTPWAARAGGTAALRAAPSPSQGIGVCGHWGRWIHAGWAGAATDLLHGHGRAPGALLRLSAARDKEAAAPAMVTGTNRPATPPIFISPGQTGLLRRLSCKAAARGTGDL